MNTPSLLEVECLLDRVYENSEASEDLWEKGFLESVCDQRKKRDYLSEGQIRTINKIRDQYSQEAILEKQAWKENWSDEHRDAAIKVAHYYEVNKPYFSDIVLRVLSDKENFFLTERDYTRFTNNKYALKILNNYKEELKFKVGQPVQIRATNKLDLANVSDNPWVYPNKSERRKYVDRVGFVIEVDAKPVRRAASGSRMYKVLITGEVAPIYAHESDLKRVKKCLVK